MKNSVIGIWLSLLLVSLLSVQCNKGGSEGGTTPPPPPPPSKPGTVKGKISNEYNQLLTGAVVSIGGGGTNALVTTTGGEYSFGSLQPGAYNLSVKKNGYIDASAIVSVAAGDTLIKDFVLKAGTAYFNLLSDTILVVKPWAAKLAIKASSNTTWSVTSSGNWLTPDKTNTSGDDSVMVNIAASTEDTIRQGSLLVQSGSVLKNIVVRQLPDVKLKQTIAIPGNGALGIADSIALIFNQPVTVKSLFPGNTYCSSDIRYSYSGNKVTFSYACAALGGDYPFTITTNNSFGDQYTFTFSIGFYQKLMNLTGTIQSYYVNDDDNSYWVITDHPNQLYKIDMETFDVVHKYDLPYEPSGFTISPYNNKIYLTYYRVPKLYILNQDGTTDEIIDIPNDTTRGLYQYDGPYIYPSMPCFTKNGKGMIWLYNNYNSYPYFWFIDAANNHRIWYQSVPGYTSGTFLSPKLNWDKTKIILSSVNGNPTIGMFDLQQMSYSSYKPTRYDIGGFVTPSRKNGNMYIGQLYFQLIANPATGFESPEINHDNRNGGNVDFLYKPGKDLAVYFSESSTMQVVDYATGKIPVKYDALYILKGTTATMNGKYVIAYWSDGNYHAKVVQIPASWFNY